MVSYNRNTSDISIISSNFDHIIYYKVGRNELVDFTTKFNKSDVELVAHTDKECIYFKYSENPFYWLQYPYYLSLLLFSGLISFLAFSNFRKSIEKKHQLELDMNRLQMLSIKNQVDPHFTLNSLNSIDYMYQNNEYEKAGKFMVKLSRLMHQTLMNSDKMICSLFEEMDFIRTYCQLEQVRSEKEFEYKIIVDESIDALELEIPKQLVFTYVENAIKHGLRPKEGSGFLKINAYSSQADLHIDIIDNGVGFEQSNVLKTSNTGKGLSIVKELIRLNKKMGKPDIHTAIDSSDTGTTVSIILKSSI